MDQTILVGVTSFTIGGVFGYILRGVRDKRGADDNNSIVLLVVTFVWALSMAVDIASATYETSPLVHSLMGLIVGFFYKPFKKEQP